MVFDISYLKKFRKQLNITQHQFAQKAGISQSMVAKIESQRLDPTYSYVKKIEEALASLTKHEEKKAADIMHHKVIAVHKHDTLKEVISLLSKHNISQVPVVENNNVIGLITEGLLLTVTKEDIAQKKVHEVMQEAPPVVAKTMYISAIIPLLQFYPLVLVSDKGKLVGVITKADVIKHLK